MELNNDFTKTRKPIEFLDAVNGLLCSSGTTVEFVQCNVARDPAGADKLMFFLTAYLPDAENIILYTSVARLNGGVVSGDTVTKNEIARRLDFPFPLLRPRKHGIKYRCRRTHPHFVQTSVYSGPVGRLFRLYDVSRLELEHAGGVVVSGRAEPQPPSRHVDVAQGPRHQRNP